MKPRDIFREWMRGCGNTHVSAGGGPLTPWKCDECTANMVAAIERAFDAEELDRQSAALEPVPVDPPSPAIALDVVPRLELRAALQERENVETANHGLRVQLHITQQMLAGANAAITLLAKGAGLSKSQHLNEQAQAAAEIAKLRAELADLKRAAGG